MLCIGNDAKGDAINSMSILVTEGDELFEYSRSGRLLQSFGRVPHPDTSSYDVGDVAADKYGRVHVLNISLLENDYLSTLMPNGTWRHTQHQRGVFGNVSDADLSIRDGMAIANRTRFDLLGFTTTSLSVPGIRGVGEVSIGLNGLLYVLDSGSPRAGVRVLDPSSFALIQTFELLDQQRSRLSARGIAVDSSGGMFIADWDGHIYKYDNSGNLIDTVDTGVRNLLDINLHSDGTLVSGSRLGEVILTDTTLESISTFSVGNGLAYVGFAAVTVPEPSIFGTLVIGLALCTARRVKYLRLVRSGCVH